MAAVKGPDIWMSIDDTIKQCCLTKVSKRGFAEYPPGNVRTCLHQRTVVLALTALILEPKARHLLVLESNDQHLAVFHVQPHGKSHCSTMQAPAHLTSSNMRDSVIWANIPVSMFIHLVLLIPMSVWMTKTSIQ